MAISKEVFDGRAAWTALPARQKMDFGMILMEWLAAAAIQDAVYSNPDQYEEPVARAATEAGRLAEESLQESFRNQVPIESVEDVAGAWRIPVIVHPVCLECGCSDQDACEGGCGWAAHRLCTACAEKAAPLPPGSVVVAGEIRHEPSVEARNG
ncbi:hypothetical protein HCU64_09820 [Methylobacterium sp. C25]|uniref:hypothetical protein n=1 Tax=Methylobacterium sp. C25 TaxID=2721622 RepID=UPI001F26F03C|nr:hypothetical protein [Methylobacterium sp. C25]MCE4224048.1 hypothetical protein [Methylobacterium sp. C25]